MTTRMWLCWTVAGLLCVSLTGPLGCSSDDDDTTTTTTATGTGTGTGTATGTDTGGTGGSGGAGQGGAGTGGQSVVEVFCEGACPFSVACGESGGGGAGGGALGWPPTLEDCMDGCVPIWADCDLTELAAAEACLEPHIDPNCDMAGLMTCLDDASVTCAEF